MIAAEALSAIDSERSLLGSVLLNHELIDQAADLVPAAFALDSHQQIFRAMQRMAKVGREINISTLIEALVDANLLSSVGSRPYIFSLTEGVPTNAQHGAFVETVRERWQKRQLVKICEDYASRASEGGEEVAELIAAADKDCLA